MIILSNYASATHGRVDFFPKIWLAQVKTHIYKKMSRFCNVLGFWRCAAHGFFTRTWGHLSYPSTWQCGWIPTSNIQTPGWHQGLAAFIILLMIFVSANLNQTLHKLVVQPMASWQWDWRSVMGWPRWIQPRETQDVSSGALVFPYFCGGRGGSPSSLKERLPPLSDQWQGRDVPPGKHAVGGER